MTEQQEIGTQGITIKTLIEEHSHGNELVVLHGLESGIARGTNSMLRQGIGIEERIDILVALSPIVSGSIVKQKDEFLKVWSPLGVVLKGGSIESFSKQDSGTVAESLSYRSAYKYTHPEIIQETIESEGMNEITVSSPEIAGLYFNLDENRKEFLDYKIKGVDVNKVAQYVRDEFEMPIFVFKDGQLYKGEIEDGKLVAIGDVLTQEEIVNTKFELDEKKKNKALQRIMDNSPFRREVLHSLDAHLIYHWEDGKRMYLHLFPKKVIEEFSQDVQEGKRSSVLTVRHPNGIPHYYYVERKNGEVKLFSWWKDSDRIHPWIDEIEDDPKLGIEGGTDWHNSGEGSVGFNIPLPIYNSGDYFENALKGVLGVYKQWKQGSPQNLEREILRRKYALAFHFYGFAKAAEFVGDDKNAKEAYKRAEKLVPRDEYEKVIQERVGPDKEFKLKPEDLEKLK